LAVDVVDVGGGAGVGELLLGVEDLLLGIGVILGDLDVQRDGDLEVFGAGHADVLEDDGLPVVRLAADAAFAREPEELGGLCADQDAGGAGVVEGLDVEGLAAELVGVERVGDADVAEGVSDDGVDAWLVERGGHDADDVGGERRRRAHRRR
jgi:hypothetical protein